MAVAITFKIGASNGNLGANGSVTATGLTTSGASLILISASVGNNSLSTVSGVTVNGSPATLGKRQVLTDGFSNAEVWWFWSTGALASVSVVVTFANSAGAGTNIDICEATGTDSNSIGNVSGTNNGSGTTSTASVVCSATGSVMYASSLNFGSSGTEAAGTNTTLLNAQNDGAGDFAASSINNQATSSGTSYTVTTTHATGQWGMAAVEVKPAAAALTPNMPIASEPVSRPPQPTRQHDAEWSSSQPLGAVVIPPIKALHEAPQPARESRSLRHEGIFQPVQPLRSPVIPVPKNFGDAPPYFQTRVQNPRALAAMSAEARGTTTIPAPKQFGDAPQPLITRRRNERVTALHQGEGLSTPALFTSRYPITRSGMKMFDQQGLPYRIKGRTGWGVITLGGSDLIEFLDDVVAHGYNAIECQMPDRLVDIFNMPKDGSGNLPFTNTVAGGTWNGTFPNNTTSSNPDVTTPNSAFWANVDAVISACYARNLLCLFFPAYLGIGGTEGWKDILTANGSTKSQAYGAFVAARYASFPNIVWMTAGDTASGFTEESDIITGITSVGSQASGPNFSAERNGGSISTDGTGVLGTTMTLNGAYDWATVTQQCQRAYTFGASTRAIPAFLLEEPYDEEGSDGTGVNTTFATQPTRRYEWWGWLNTIGGYVAGNGYIWRFAPSGTPLATDNWKNHKNTQATQDLGRLNAFMELWPNTNDLVPGGLGSMRTLVVSGAGTIDTSNFNCAAQTSTGDLMIAYVSPGGASTIQLDLRSMAGRPIRARWWDPTAATFTTNGSAAGTFTLANTASAQSFTTPGTNSTGSDSDWVLVLEAQPAQAGVEVPEQIARSQRASRAPLRIQNLEVLAAIAAPAAPTAWGYEPATAGARATAAPKVSAGGDAGATAPGPIDWDPIVSATMPRARAAVRPSSSAEPPPPPPFPATGFEIGPPISRSRPAAPLSAGADAGAAASGPVDWDPSAGPAVGRITRVMPIMPGGDPLPPPPFPPIAWVLDPSAPVRVYRAEHRTGNQLVLPPPPFPPTGFEVGAAIARALARLQLDQPIALPGAGVADWTPDVYGDLARAARGRFSPDQDRFPGLAVVTLPAWGFEPEPPRTRSPAADRRLVNGEPLRSPVAVVLTAWGFEPPPAPARGPRQDRRGVAGEPLPAPILAALTAWFEASGAAARGPGARLWMPGEPLPAFGPSDWVETAPPALARGASRSRPPTGGDPLPLLVLTPWGWESLGAARERGARIDARSAEASPPLIVSAPAGFDPTAPPLRAPARRRETWAEGLPVVFIPPPPAPWGYEPSSPRTRWVSSARFPLGGDGTTLVIVVLRSVPRARVGGGGTKASGSGGPTRAKRT